MAKRMEQSKGYTVASLQCAVFAHERRDQLPAAAARPGQRMRTDDSVVHHLHGLAVDDGGPAYFARSSTPRRQIRQQQRLAKCAPSRAIPPSKLTTLATGRWTDQVPVSGAISTDGQQLLTVAPAADAPGESHIGNRAPTRTSATPIAPRATTQRRPCCRTPRRSDNAATGSTRAAMLAWKAGCVQNPPSAGASKRSTGATIQCTAQAIAATIPTWSNRRVLEFWPIIRLFIK